MPTMAGVARNQPKHSVRIFFITFIWSPRETDSPQLPLANAKHAIERRLQIDSEPTINGFNRTRRKRVRAFARKMWFFEGTVFVRWSGGTHSVHRLSVGILKTSISACATSAGVFGNVISTLALLNS